MNNPENCYYCRGRNTMEIKRINHIINTDHQPKLINNLPAKVCIQCGEKVFSEDTLDYINRVRTGSQPHTTLQTIQVYAHPD